MMSLAEPIRPGDKLSSQVTEQEILDWYDGIVLGLVRYKGRSSWYYQSLVSWDPESGRRVLALVELESSTRDQLFGTLRSESGDLEDDKTLEVFREQSLAALRSVEGEALLVSCQRVTDIVLGVAKVELGSIRPYLGREVDNIIESPPPMEIVGSAHLDETSSVDGSG